MSDPPSVSRRVPVIVMQGYPFHTSVVRYAVVFMIQPNRSKHRVLPQAPLYGLISVHFNWRFFHRGVNRVFYRRLFYRLLAPSVYSGFPHIVCNIGNPLLSIVPHFITRLVSVSRTIWLCPDGFAISVKTNSFVVCYVFGRCVNFRRYIIADKTV